MDFFQGEHVVLYASYVDAFGELLNTGVSGTKVTVYHFESGTRVVDILSGSMTQDPVYLNIFNYEYQVPSGAYLTNYNVAYNALYSGTGTYFTETYNLFPSTTVVPVPLIIGNIPVSGTVVDQSGIGINATQVLAILNNSLFSTTTTNASGVYNMLLNAGQYVFEYIASGYFNNQQIRTIPSGSGYDLGTITMVPNNVGSLLISDTYVWQNQYMNYIPIPNLKVSIFNNNRPAGEDAVSVTYTNASGTFYANVNPGLYAMTVEGQYWTGAKYDRYHYDYNIEVNSVWSGTGVGPYNFTYLDTSKYNYLS